MKRTIYIFMICLLAVSTAFGQMTKANSGIFALTNATVVTVTQGTQENTTVLISAGKITAIGKEVAIPAGATTIDCTGKFIYPGMINGGTSVGLVEVGSLSETQDNRELGDIKPHIEAITAINPNSVVIPVTRVEGITSVLSAPTGGMIPGMASLINLHGYTPQQMYAGFQGLVVNFPSSGRRGRRDDRSEDDIAKAMEQALKALNEVWDKAEEYSRIAAAYKQNNRNPKPGYYPEMEAMIPVVNGQIPVLIEVNAAKDIQAAITWVEKRKVKAIFTGVSEGWRVADELAKSGIPVITGPVLSLPTRSSDRYDIPYRNAGIMGNAGVKVALRTNDVENARNLPFNAGYAAAYGMGKEEALKAVTINAAEIFGLGDQLGSIEVGKWASLIVTDGDPFEPQTGISEVFIAGWQMPLDSRQIRLYDEFLERSPGNVK